MKIVNCTRCDNTGWVCETHKYRPWDGSNACGCGGAGMPCPDCNPFDETTLRGRRPASSLMSLRQEGLRTTLPS